MREILFRGKTYSGEWVYGYYIRYGWTHQEKDYIVPLYASDLYAKEVIPSTVGQYTGLTDKNGKKIFEGDIITAYFKSNRSKQRFSVIFENGTFLFDNSRVKVPINDIYRLKIIGNIHNNPELLKGAEQ